MQAAVCELAIRNKWGLAVVLIKIPRLNALRAFVVSGVRVKGIPPLQCCHVENAKALREVVFGSPPLRLIQVVIIEPANAHELTFSSQDASVAVSGM